jgi:purine nucleoside permease
VIRVLSALLIRLHPPAFRERFAQEMLWIFEEAGNAWGAGSLLRDAIVSLLRQWLIRSDFWKWLVAGIAGVDPLIIAFGSFLSSR